MWYKNLIYSTSAWREANGAHRSEMFSWLWIVQTYDSSSCFEMSMQRVPWSWTSHQVFESTMNVISKEGAIVWRLHTPAGCRTRGKIDERVAIRWVCGSMAKVFLVDVEKEIVSSLYRHFQPCFNKLSRKCYVGSWFPRQCCALNIAIGFLPRLSVSTLRGRKIAPTNEPIFLLNKGILPNIRLSVLYVMSCASELHPWTRTYSRCAII
jgi:hypothetical protein